MAEGKKKFSDLWKGPRQDWKPHPVLTVLQKIWMFLFGAAKIALGALATVVVICGICVVVLVGKLGDYLQEDILPNASMDMGSFGLDLNSYVWYVDSDGDIKLLQNVFAENKRDWVDYEDIPQALIDATVSIEDKRFFTHQGVDWITTIKACARMFFGDGSMGGSTITQQLVKNTTGANSVTVQRKVLEIFRATDLEKRYEKEVILEEYLNRIYMGQRCYGVKTAAANYFGKELEKLSVAECASLISITNNPSLYNPYRTGLDAGGKTGAERNRERQEDVLWTMKEEGYITQDVYRAAWDEEITFKKGIDLEDTILACEAEGCDYRDTVSTYKVEKNVYHCPKCNAVVDVDQNSSQAIYSWYVDTVIEDVARGLAEHDGLTEWNDAIRKSYVNKVSSGGYHIYACIDMDVQKQLDKIYQDLSQIPKVRSGQQLQSAMVIIDNSTGDIVALSGGVGEKLDHDAWNRATDSALQTGSSIKPLTVYAPAFESGAISPATVIKDLPLNYNSGSAWPKNDDRVYNYAHTIYRAVTRSVNAVAANTLNKIGVKYSFNFAKEQFGLSGLLESYTAYNGRQMTDMDFAPLAMGAQTVGISVRDMASAFAVFANEGTYREGRTFTKVYDNEGNLVLDNTQDSRTILSEKTVNYMNYCLENAVNGAGGTGSNARISGQKVYGKTGTTASNKDRWFCGFTGYYTAAVWCGYDQPEIIRLVNGGNPAAQLFKKVLDPVHKGLKSVSLCDTSKMGSVTVCLDSGKLATEACKADIRGGRTETVKAYPDDYPTAKCDKHVEVEICKEGDGVANSFCRLFAEKGKTTLEKKSLTKLTQKEIDEMLRAKAYLKDAYLEDNYIYLIKEDGTDAIFKGIYGNMNKTVDAPYIVCTKHNQAAWDAYQKETATPDPGPGEEGTETPG